MWPRAGSETRHALLSERATIHELSDFTLPYGVTGDLSGVFGGMRIFASTQGTETARRGAVPLTRRLTGRSIRSSLGFQRQKFHGAGAS